MSEELDSILKKVSKSLDIRIGSMSDVGAEVEAISTGNFGVDDITGIGGIPRGRLSEFFGLQSSGKTTLAAQVAVEAQKMGLRVLYADFEQAFDPKYARALGIDVDDPEKFLFMQPDSLEQGANAINELVGTGEIGLLVVDSVAAMMPEAMFDKEVGQATVAERAKLLSPFLGTLTVMAKQTNTCCIFLNHEMELLDMGGRRRPGMPAIKTTPGGRALKFFASLRLNFYSYGKVTTDTKDPLTGETVKLALATNVRVTVEKNKVGSPYRSALGRIEFGKGMVQSYTVLHVLLAYKRITKGSGGIFRFKEGVPVPPLHEVNDKGPYVKGEQNLLNILQENPAFLEQWLELAKACLIAEEEPVPEKVVAELLPGSNELKDMFGADEEDAELAGLLASEGYKPAAMDDLLAP